MFDHYNHLGSFNPYYKQTAGNSFEIYSDFRAACETISVSRDIDVISIIEFVNRSFFLGDRTVVTGINRSPWMSKPSIKSGEWEVFKVPDHAENMFSEEEVARELFRRISDEILSYVGVSTNVGVLLSGGMDSRIVAGTLDHLIKTGKLSNIDIVGLTWGNTDSRDVQYAKRICQSLGWEWKHYVVGPEDLLNNIEVAAINGCEYSPIHLHALPQISEIHLDLVLAGSYGDSIGRGEYSSVKVKNLKRIDAGFRNPNSIIKSNVFKHYKDSWKADVEPYHRKFPQLKSYQQFEQDYQLHYMRRMLNPCMEVVGKEVPFHQVFTSPDVFGYMWQIHPDIRNDKIYKHILGFFETNLSDIPWARTGLIYPETKGEADSLQKNHHSYKEYVSKELYSDISGMVLSDEIQNLEIFNISSLKSLLSLVKRIPHRSNYYIDVLMWIAALSKTVSIYKLNGIPSMSKNYIDEMMGNTKAPAEFLARKIWSDVKQNILK